MKQVAADANQSSTGLKPSRIFSEEDAVSPVIGVILMVAITVILAAVIGAFVLGIGDDPVETPTTNWGVDEDINSSNYVQNVTLTHKSGDRIESDTLSVSVPGNSSDVDGDEALTAGSEIHVNLNDSRIGSSGDELLLIWSPQGSTDTSTINTHTFSSDYFATVENASV